MLCVICVAAVEDLVVLIVSIFTQLHRSGLNLEFETLFE